MKANTFSALQSKLKYTRSVLGRFQLMGYGWLGAAILAALIWIPGASTQASPCTQFTLDGVTLSLCQSLMPAPVVSSAAPTDAIQMAVAMDRSAGYKELTITAIPFGLRSPAEDLPTAAAGSAAAFRQLLSDYRAQQGGQPQPGPATTFFGQAVPGTVSTASLPAGNVTPQPVTITEWVVEAGGRIWIIRVIQAKPSGVQASAGLDLSLSSPDVNQASSSLAAQAMPRAPSVAGQAVSALSDLPAPSWWNGETCDYSHYTWPPLFYGNEQNPTHRTPYPLGASYRGVLACGPRPYYDGAPDVIVQFFPGAWGELEWECVELSMRFMRLAYGIPPYSGNGKDVVWNYTGTELVKIANGTAGEVPAPGDILSYCNGCVRVGHTSVVAASNVNAYGYGTLTVMEQNNAYNGWNTLQVNGWVVGSGVTGWLHFPGNGNVSGVVRNSGGQLVAGAQVRLEKWMIDRTTTTDGNGAYYFGDIPAGSASVSASFVDGCGSAAGAVTASIVAHQTQPAPDIVMADLKGSLSGVVKNSSQQPVAGAQVEFSHCGVTRSTTTDSHGAYSLTDLPTGWGSVSAVYAPGSCYARGDASVNIDAGQNSTLPDFVLDAPALYDAAYVADITFPDQAVFAPGQQVVKTWRLRNTGCLPWDGSFKLAFVHGDLMGGGDVDVPYTPTDQAADLTVTLNTPPSGSHFGYWRLRNPQGDYLGPLIFAQVNAQAPSPYLTLQADPPSPVDTSRVRIYARADGLPNFSAMRLLIDGVEVAQTGVTELYYTWNTAGYSAIGHSLVVEAVTWNDLGWRNPERVGSVYVLQGTSSARNLPPDRPTLLSPANWHSAVGSAAQLCAQGSDPDGGALAYQFEVTGPAGTSTSGWVNGCYTAAALSPGAYTWRARAKNTWGTQSLWSASRHFSLATGSGGITQFAATPVGVDQVRVWPCTSLTEPVTLSVRVNTAADGSGSWEVIGEPTGRCATADTAPVWNTLPYADGAHLLRVVALSPAGAVMSDTVFTLGPRRPAAPTLLAPVADSGSPGDPVYLKLRTVTFRWAKAARAMGYTLLVSTNPSPQDDASPMLRQALGGDILASTVMLDQDYAALYWQVLAVNASGVNASVAQRLNIHRTVPLCNLQSTPINANTWQVNWTGLDDTDQIAAFNLRYRAPGTMEWLNWLQNLPGGVTSAVFTGQAGQNYSFWCQALDQAGNDSDRHIFLPIIAH